MMIFPYSNTNPKWPVIVAFCNISGEVWTENTWFVFRFLRRSLIGRVLLKSTLVRANSQLSSLCATVYTVILVSNENIANSRLNLLPVDRTTEFLVTTCIVSNHLNKTGKTQNGIFPPREGGYSKSFIRGGSAPDSNPLPFYIPLFI